MITNEAQLLAHLKRVSLELYPSHVWGRHVDRFTTGVADIEIVHQGMTTWAELKYLKTPGIPRDKPLISRGLVTPLQAKFLLERHQAGIRAFAVIGIGTIVLIIPARLLSLHTTDSTVRSIGWFQLNDDAWVRRLISGSRD